MNLYFKELLWKIDKDLFNKLVENKESKKNISTHKQLLSEIKKEKKRRMASISRLEKGEELIGNIIKIEKVLPRVFKEEKQYAARAK